MANFDPIAYTGRSAAGTKRAGQAQFDPVDFSVNANGVVSLAGAGALQTLNTQTPVAGNYTIAGTANQLSVANTSGTTTFSLPAAITFPGSALATTSLAATTTVTAGTGITATTGNITATTGNVAAGAAVTSTTTMTAGTSLTATAGDITATLGHLILNGAAKQIRIHGGAVTDFIGSATLVNGTVTVSNTNIASTDIIIPIRVAANSTTTLGVLSYTISAATSFTITSLILGTPGSTQTGDVSTVAYIIVRQV